MDCQECTRVCGQSGIQKSGQPLKPIFPTPGWFTPSNNPGQMLYTTPLTFHNNAKITTAPMAVNSDELCSACLKKDNCEQLSDADNLRTCRWNLKNYKCEKLEDLYHQYTATYLQVPEKTEASKSRHLAALKDTHNEVRGRKAPKN